ncbi:VENN motif pre-toxin domain-containing protein [[Pasteurella] aerogenes]
MEAHFTGNNAAAGALGALTAEAAAPLIMQTLYGTEKPENLTDSQKQNVANLSQIAAGLSGGLVGDSTVSGIAGAEIGKRAVENNYLYRQEAEELLNLRLALQLTTNAEEKEKIQIRINELEKLDQDRQEHIKTVCPDFGKSSSACSAAIADAEKAKAGYNGWTDQYQSVSYNSKDNHPYSVVFTQDYDRVNEALVGKDELTRQKEELALDLAKSGKMSKEEAYRILDNSMTLSDTLMAVGGIKTVSNEKLLAFLTGKYKLPVMGKTQGYENKFTRISNPHSPYLEVDKYGNEIYYRALSEPDYKRLLIEGKLPATNETFISPLSAYSKQYEGVLVRFYTKPGTSLSLQEIGVAGNSATKREVFPNMNRAEKGWSTNNQAQFKLEGRRNNPEINNGNGVVNTGLGKTEGLNRFNEISLSLEK